MEEVRYWEVVIQEFSCEHDDTHLVRYIKSNGVTCVRIQCKVCGHNVREVPKKGLNAESLPLFDESLRGNWEERRRARREELAKEQREKFIEGSDKWWADYSAYLRSERWHVMRQRVLERDSHICQACLRNKATQVHHVSYNLYNEVGRSAAFELVSICFTCHKEIHPDRAMAQQELTANSFNPYLGTIPQWMPE